MVKKITFNPETILDNETFNPEFEMYLNTTLFNFVEIETTSVCNRKCNYCPHSKIDRGKHFMKESTFLKIINNLKDLKYKGF